MSLSADLLDAYTVPDPMASAEQYDRFHHLDVPKLTDEDVARDLTVLRLFNHFHDSEWHREREIRLANRG